MAMDLSKLKSGMKTEKQNLAKREKTLKPKPGVNRYVLMPGWRKGEEHVLHHKFGAHYVKNAAEELLAVYPCSAATFDEPCEVCDALAKAVRSAGDDDTIKLLGEAKGKPQYLVNVLELDGINPNTPQTLELTKTTFSALLGIVEDWSVQLFGETDPQIIVIERTGKGLETRYTVSISPKTHKMPAGVGAAIPDLDAFVRQDSEDQKRRVLNAINTVVGILPAVVSRDKPATTTTMLSHSKASAEDAVVRKPAPALSDDLDSLLDEVELDDIPL